jgi:hypothetical protein
MEEVLNQAFRHVETLGRHVAEGHYDIISPRGEIILPSAWERVIEPGWSITMQMWPISPPKKPPQRQRQGPPPMGLPPPGRNGPEEIDVFDTAVPPREKSSVERGTKKLSGPIASDSRSKKRPPPWPMMLSTRKPGGSLTPRQRAGVGPPGKPGQELGTESNVSSDDNDSVSDSTIEEDLWKKALEKELVVVSKHSNSHIVPDETTRRSTGKAVRKAFTPPERLDFRSARLNVLAPTDMGCMLELVKQRTAQLSPGKEPKKCDTGSMTWL